MTDRKLYTYCSLDENGQAVKLELNSPGLELWKKRYANDLTEFSKKEKPAAGGENIVDVRRYYCDPDGLYKENCDHHFFLCLEAFLRKREAALSCLLQGNFQYRFEEGKGIQVSGTDQAGNGIRPFYLRSDQLGFSAPSNAQAHPYDLFIVKSVNKEAAAKQAAEWVASSRTIGGSFLWPTPFYFSYNPARGGKITSNRKFYIQDRVDLTLWEIKYRYEGENKHTVLRRVEEPDSNLSVWLEHFDSFEMYVKFFCFDDFVSMHDQKAVPVNILTGETQEPVWENGENPEIKISDAMAGDELEKMLYSVNRKILSRSESILKILDGE